MKKRKLGALEVSEIGAGAMSISANYGQPADKKQGINTLRKALHFLIPQKFMGPIQMRF